MAYISFDHDIKLTFEQKLFSSSLCDFKINKLGKCRKQNGNKKHCLFSNIFFLKLIGYFENMPIQEIANVYPQHQDLLGIRWRSKKRFCSSPVGWCKHRANLYKGDRGITFVQAKGLYHLTSYVLQIGSHKFLNRPSDIIIFNPHNTKFGI
jgi:hypothetical protein